MAAVGETQAGDHSLYIAGGQKLDRGFLSSLVLPTGMRVLLYRNLEPKVAAGELIDAQGEGEINCAGTHYGAEGQTEA